MPYIFGYGSLANRSSSSELAQLEGYRRVWSVATDNSRDLPGYKYYARKSDGARPIACVAFLNLEPGNGSSVNGVLFPVDDAQLKGLDERERNYQRRDVTRALVDSGGIEVVWAYIGTAAAAARFSAGPTVVSREYLEGVEAAFASLGPLELARFRASTDPPGCPIVDLERIELPPVRGLRTCRSHA